jgi:hypothetical protein
MMKLVLTNITTGSGRVPLRATSGHVYFWMTIKTSGPPLYWFIQEVALAEEVMFYCGSKTVDGKLFLEAVTIYTL